MDRNEILERIAAAPETEIFADVEQGLLVVRVVDHAPAEQIEGA